MMLEVFRQLQAAETVDLKLPNDQWDHNVVVLDTSIVESIGVLPFSELSWMVPTMKPIRYPHIQMTVSILSIPADEDTNPDNIQILRFGADEIKLFKKVVRNPRAKVDKKWLIHLSNNLWIRF